MEAHNSLDVFQGHYVMYKKKIPPQKVTYDMIPCVWHSRNDSILQGDGLGVARG